MIPWQIPFLAIANRMRDGWITELTADPLNPAAPSSTNKFYADIWDFFTLNSQMGRLLLWALPFALTVFPFAHFIPWQDNFLYFTILVIVSYIGSTWAAWGKYINPPFTLSSFANLGLQGFLFTLPAGFFVAASNPVLGLSIALSGFLIAPSCYFGWKIPSKIPGFEQGTRISSAIFGLCIGTMEAVVEFCQHL